eukprot:15354179-Ditylum_brightwellii.AAC.1
MKRQCSTIQQQSAICRKIVLSNDSSFEGLVMPHYGREGCSSDSPEEDYSISKDDHNHSVIDTTKISKSSIG